MQTYNKKRAGIIRWAYSRVLMFTLIAAASVIPHAVLAADCKTTVGSTMVNISPVNVSSDIAVGQSITGDQSYDKVAFATCESSFTWSKTFYGGITAQLGYVGNYNGRQTFSTNIPGIGVQFGADMPITSNKGHSSSHSGWITANSSAQLFSMSDIGWGEVFTISITPKLNLIKTATSVGSGALSGSVGYGSASGNEGSAKITVNFSGTISASGCTIANNQDMTITLADAHKADLPSVGSTWGQSGEKDISLSCNAGTNVYATFSGTQASGTSDTSVLQNNGTAQGIGVQLIDLHDGNNNPINMNYRFSPVTNAGATATIPIAARYIRTGDLSAGSVDASATYTLDYD